MTNKFLYILTVIVMTALTGCRDDIELGPYDIGEGTARVQLTLDYMPVAETTLSSSRTTMAPPGDGFDILESEKNDIKLKLLVYKPKNDPSKPDETDGELAKVIELQPDDYTISNPPRTGADADPAPTSPTLTSDPTTGRITATINDIPYGRYYIFAVAYISDMTAANAPKTISELRTMRRDWDTSNYRKNRELFGAVTLDGESRPSLEENRIVVINRPTVSLHGWLRRLVSKVTISFDGSGLRDNIYVYLRRATVHNIARHCLLGKDNDRTQIKEIGDVYTNFQGNKVSEGGWQDSIPKAGHRIDYFDRNPNHPSASDDWEMHLYWPVITRGNPKFAEEDHAHDAKSLTFYENMQGVGSENCKLQKQKQDNFEQLEFLEKDGFELGTYVEIEAYYVSLAEDNFTEGKIFYRFMLGKNITDDFNAQRNHHFKLTLRLKGNANEYDWHVDYHEDPPTIQAPSPFYVSYLPNQASTLEFKVNAGKNWELTGVKADIIANSWLPQRGGVDDKEYEQYIGGFGSRADTIGYWDGNKKHTYKDVSDNGNTLGIDSMFYGKNNPYLGFLSLRKAPFHTIDYTGGWTGWDTRMDTYSKNYYTTCKQGSRTYAVPKSYGASVDITPEHNRPNVNLIKTLDENGESTKVPADTAYVELSKDANNNDVYNYVVPLYTRARAIIPGSTFTSYNPFVSSERHAYIKLTAYFTRKGEPNRKIYVENIVKVIQVPRLTNPTVIWRRGDNPAPFAVTLTRQKVHNGAFTPVVSHGPWRARIYKDFGADWVELSPLGNAEQNGDEIIGHTGSNITFQYKPKSTISSGARFGVIEIDYHNYDCHHYIYLRQGYDPVEIIPNITGSAKWSCFNLYDQDTECKSPLSAGTYFKAGNLACGILERNNLTYGWSDTNTDNELSVAYYNSLPNHTLTYVTKKTIACSDGKNHTWDEISSIHERAKTNNGTQIFPESLLGTSLKDSYKVAEYDNFNLLTNNCYIRFGIAYDDNATKTETDYNKVRGFHDYDNDGKSDIEGYNGIRCITLVNKNGGENLILPLSSTGYGRRKQYETDNSGSNSDATDIQNNGRIYAGRLRYANRKSFAEASTTSYRPLVVINYRCYGALYWLATIKDGAPAWDMNYSDINFGKYSTVPINFNASSTYDGSNNTGNTNDNKKGFSGESSDAALIKLIKK